MKVEFLVDKSDYKKLLDSINFVAKNGMTVKNDSHKIKGKTNYILTLTCEKNNISSAKALSEMRIVVEKIFTDKNIKFRILIDEALQFFAKSLYPLACDFEIKLRSIVYMVMFDIDEQANSMAVDTFKKTVKKADKQMVELPKDDFLSKLTFDEFFNFLFDNNAFIDNAKDVVYQKNQQDYNRCLSKAELLKRIDAIEERTIWNVIFAPLFPKSVIPNIYEDIHEYRNMIMHVRDIDYTNYDRIKRTYKSGIKDLEQNLSRELVADDSKGNIGLLAQTFVNSFSIYRELINARKVFDLLNNDELRAVLERVNDIQTHINALTKPISISYMEHVNKITELQRKFGTIHVDPDLLDRIQAMQRILPSQTYNDNKPNGDIADGSNDLNDDSTNE